MDSLYENNNKIWVISVSSCCFIVLMVIIYRKYFLYTNNSQEESTTIDHILTRLQEFRNQNNSDVDSNASTIQV